MLTADKCFLLGMFLMVFRSNSWNSKSKYLPYIGYVFSTALTAYSSTDMTPLLLPLKLLAPLPSSSADRSLCSSFSYYQNILKYFIMSFHSKLDRLSQYIFYRTKISCCYCSCIMQDKSEFQNKIYEHHFRVLIFYIIIFFHKDSKEKIVLSSTSI